MILAIIIAVVVIILLRSKKKQEEEEGEEEQIQPAPVEMEESIEVDAEDLGRLGLGEEVQEVEE